MTRLVLFIVLTVIVLATRAGEKEEIIEWCHDQTGDHERASVKGCIDQENEAANALMGYPKEAKSIIERCVRQMKQGGWKMVKKCADKEIGVLAEKATRSGDYQTAFSIWRSLAEGGDADAQYNLGVMYDNHGYGVERDDQKAVDYYQTAANSGHSGAQYNLGVKYMDGSGVRQSFDEALKWLQLAAEQGNTDAQVVIGSMHHHGEGVAQNSKEAFKWFLMAANNGDAQAQYNVGTMYANGDGVTQDNKLAHAWLNLSTFLFPPSQERSEAIEKRDLVTRKLTSEQKHDLAIAYVKGEGGDLPTGYTRPDVTGHNTVIVELLRKAAEQGLAAAQRDLGYVYKYGLIGVMPDERRMKEWFLKAGDQGSVHAQYELAEFYNSKPPFEYVTDYAAARKWYKPAADQGLVDAMIELGKLYDIGKGGPVDYVRAYMWYDRATAIGSRLALANRTSVESKMTKRQISEAQALSREWAQEVYERKPLLAQ